MLSTSKNSNFILNQSRFCSCLEPVCCFKCFIGLHKLIFIKQISLTLPFVNAYYFLMESESVEYVLFSVLWCPLLFRQQQWHQGNFPGNKLQAERLPYLQKLICSSLSVVYRSITITIKYRVTWTNYLS